MDSKLEKCISEHIKSAPVVMFVKGTREEPMCGFSKAVMDVFDRLGAEYKTIDVIADPDIREGVKQYTQWPTIPQIFVHGEFVGGCDIVRDLYNKGELEKMLQKHSVS